MISLNLEEYNYDLPRGRIAQYPVKERDSSKILIYNGRLISEDLFKNIDKYIPGDNLLVFNNSGVVKARLFFRTETGANIEILCLEPLSPADYGSSFSSTHPVEWKCMIGNIKKWKNGIIKKVFIKNEERYEISAEKVNPEGDAWRIRFACDCHDMTFGEALESAGNTPLPPYIDRPDEKEDSVRYQTVYSSVKGSVAAPTAGLHFSNNVLNKLLQKGIKSAELTLHVGAGTFQPVKTGNILEHEMHREHFLVSIGTIELLLSCSGKIIPVGTTTVRTLESIYWLGLKTLYNPVLKPEELYLEQWEAYEMKSNIAPRKSLETLISWMRKNRITCVSSSTRIIILPGYNFRMTDGMITNFHQPKSTLLILISAWAGEEWKRIYSYALENNFRFLSYGDSSLLLR